MQPVPDSPEHAAAAGLAQAVERRLRGWIAATLGDVEIASAAPDRSIGAARAVGLYLMSLGPLAETRATKTPPLQFSALYLVTASSADDLFELAFAAMEQPGQDVDLAPLDAAGWLAFGVPPRPAFTLRIPLRRSRSKPAAAPAVRAPLVLAPTALTSLRGTLTGPGDIALAMARVELVGLGLATSSDPRGSFRFVGVPADAALRVRVLARGSTRDFDVGRAGDLAGALRLSMDFP